MHLCINSPILLLKLTSQAIMISKRNLKDIKNENFCLFLKFLITQRIYWRPRKV